MSMSTSVVGFIPPDDEWKQKKQIYDLCKQQKIEVPDEVLEFFNGDVPDDCGKEVEIESAEWQNEYASGLEITVADLPKNVKVIRFYNAW